MRRDGRDRWRFANKRVVIDALNKARLLVVKTFEMFGPQGKVKSSNNFAMTTLVMFSLKM